MYYWGRESPMGPYFRAKNWWRKRRAGSSGGADPETVARVRAIGSTCKAEFDQARIEQLARIVAGKRAPGPVGSL